MDKLLKVYVRAREEAGQSMTEYALIMAAIAGRGDGRLHRVGN